MGNGSNPGRLAGIITAGSLRTSFVAWLKPGEGFNHLGAFFQNRPEIQIPRKERKTRNFFKGEKKGLIRAQEKRIKRGTANETFPCLSRPCRNSGDDEEIEAPNLNRRIGELVYGSTIRLKRCHERAKIEEKEKELWGGESRVVGSKRRALSFNTRGGTEQPRAFQTRKAWVQCACIEGDQVCAFWEKTATSRGRFDREIGGMVPSRTWGGHGSLSWV